MFHVCRYYAALSVSCSPVLERADPLALLCVMFSFAFVTFSYDVSG